MYTLRPHQIARFWLKVRKFENCWEWQGAINHNGYGRFSLKGKTIAAHRISYFLFKGCIQGKNIICHSCDNPRCVNPDHLWEGTSRQNTLDMILKGNLNRQRSKRKIASSKFSGVSYRKKYGKWRARKMINYKNILIGNFDSEEEAYDAVKKFHPPQ